MRGLSIIACAAAFVGSTVPGAAQQKTPTPSKTPATADECISTEGKVECKRTIERGFGARMDSAMMKRAALGLQLSPTGTARDTLGVFVSSVTPKGPAENAGIIEGDRIVSINGVDLRVAPGDIEDGYASGLPSHRLQREVAKLTPGSRVNVRVYSGGRIREVQVTAGRASDLMRSRAFINFGDGPGNSFIFRDGTDFPPMSRMELMPQMERMRLMETMPQMEKIREMMPELRKMEMSPEWRKLQESMPEFRKMELNELPLLRLKEDGFRKFDELRRLSPDRVYRIRTPRTRYKVAPNRAKVEAEKKARIQADSLKKLDKN
jgi:PDZ domain-containing protein